MPKIKEVTKVINPNGTTEWIVEYDNGARFWTDLDQEMSAFVKSATQIDRYESIWTKIIYSNK